MKALTYSFLLKLVMALLVILTIAIYTYGIVSEDRSQLASWKDSKQSFAMQHYDCE